MYFCYILRSLNEKYKNETYIGFTDDPLHRIRQHNGLIKGGAKFTKRKRPWKIVLVISNFPNKIIALKFEWAWQNPFKSTLISKDIENIEIPNKNNKKKYFTSLEFKLKALNILINSKIFEKIYLNIYIFDDIKETMQLNDTKIIIKVTEETFKDEIEKKIFNENNNISLELIDLLPNEISDKCILCEDDININSKNKFKNKINGDSSFNSESQNENNDNENENELNDEYIVNCPKCFSKFHMFCIANSNLDKINEFALIPKDTKCIICDKISLWSEWTKNLTNYNI